MARICRFIKYPLPLIAICFSDLSFGYLGSSYLDLSYLVEKKAIVNVIAFFYCLRIRMWLMRLGFISQFFKPLFFFMEFMFRGGHIAIK